jgi:adenine-specific DNA-methyltransferase
MTENILALTRRIIELESELKKTKDNQWYWLKWEDKPEEFEERAKNALPVLKEEKKLKINNKHHLDHLIIEGDNYHALSTLNYTHKWAVDVIYIDPPYNTGNKDFIYNDNYVDKEDSYRHSKWLSFMNKRLKLAKNLLSDTWVIFMSIDDNEFSQLKLLCDEIFWENNFIAKINRIQSKWKNNWTHFNFENDYILVYAREKTLFSVKKTSSLTDENLYKYKDAIWKWKKRPLEMQGTDVHLGSRKLLWYSVYLHPKSNDIKILYDYDITRKILYDEPDKGLIWDGYVCFRPRKSSKWYWIWRRNEERLIKDIYELFFDFKEARIYLKDRYKENIESLPWTNVEIPNAWWTIELQNIFWEKPFDYPKPTKLIKRILNRVTNENITVLDFFAWSWTTGHAVLELNEEDWWNRKFILCSSKENTKEDPDKNVCKNVTYERVKRVMQWYMNTKGEQTDWLSWWNLRYYTTEFIKTTKSTDDLRHKFINLCDDLLCVKESTFEEVKIKGTGDYLKIFNKQDKYTAILYDIHHFDALLNFLENTDGRIAVYIFSLSKEIYEEELAYLHKDIVVQNIPDDILQTYKKIFNF